MRSFKENEQLERIMNGVASGIGANNSDVLDTRGFDSVTIIALIGTVAVTGTVTMKIQQGAESDASDMADLTGTSVVLTDTDDNKMLAVELYRPRERYVRAVVTTVTAAGVIDGVVAVLRDPHQIPVTQGSDVAAFELHAAPAEGTA